MISKLNYHKFFICLILIANIEFFSIPGTYKILGGICNYNIKFLVFVLCVLYVCVWIYKKEFKICLKWKAFGTIFRYYLVMIVFLILYSAFKYQYQSLPPILKEYGYLFCIILILPLADFLINDANIKWFTNCICIIGFILATYSIVTKIIYDSTGVLLMDAQMQVVQARGGSLRLARTATFICIPTIIAFAEIIKSKNKASKIYLMMFITGIINLFWVSKTRMIQLSVLLACYVIFYFSSKKKGRVMIILAICVFLPMILAMLGDFYNSFFEATSIAGTEVRIDACRYYLPHAFDGVIFGLGLLSSKNYGSLLHGPYGLYYLSDLGYLGYFSVFGIAGLIFLIRLYIWCIRGLRNVNIFLHPEMLGLFVFLLISGLSLMFTDAQRCLYLPFVLAYFYIGSVPLKPDEVKQSCD